MKYNKATTSISPKTTFYHNNGLGRDTYISFNSGGILARNHPNVADLSGGRLSNKQKYGYKITNPVKTVHYLPDGTGRDVYIINDEGGFSSIPSQTQKNFNYLTSLRTYSRYPSSFMLRNSMSTSNRDFFTESQGRLPVQEQVKQQKIFRVQQQLIRRLQEPRAVNNTMSASAFNNRGGGGQPYISAGLEDNNNSSKYMQFTKIMKHNLKSPNQPACKKYIVTQSDQNYYQQSRLPKVVGQQFNQQQLQQQ